MESKALLPCSFCKGQTSFKNSYTHKGTKRIPEHTVHYVCGIKNLTQKACRVGKCSELFTDKDIQACKKEIRNVTKKTFKEISFCLMVGLIPVLFARVMDPKLILVGSFAETGIGVMVVIAGGLAVKEDMHEGISEGALSAATTAGLGVVAGQIFGVASAIFASTTLGFTYLSYGLLCDSGWKSLSLTAISSLTGATIAGMATTLKLATLPGALALTMLEAGAAGAFFGRVFERRSWLTKA